MKPWSPEDDDLLREWWGCSGGMPSIAARLGRSVEAVNNRAIELRLGPYLDVGEDVAFNQLYRIVIGEDVSGGYQWTLEKWQKLGLKIRRRRVKKCRFYMVNISHFWRWAKKHQDQLDFSRFEENALGLEPEWVKVKRRVDQRNRTLTTWKKCKWSKIEDMLLEQMCLAGCYSWEQFCGTFQRTSSSIRRRIYDLALPSPPKSAPIKWSAEDMKQLVGLLESGYSIDYCARILKRSAQAVRGKIEWIKKKGLWVDYGGKPLSAPDNWPHEQRARQAVGRADREQLQTV